MDEHDKMGRTYLSIESCIDRLCWHKTKYSVYVTTQTEIY